MGAIDGIPLLLQAAEVSFSKIEDQITEVHEAMSDPGRGGQTSLVNALRTITVQTELTIVGIFSIFEARMQHHFPGNGFFNQLRDRLKAADQVELANRVRIYYLAVNVLKHGRGGSYEKLLKIDDLPFPIKQPDSFFFDDEGDIAEPEALIDIRAPGFFTGLIETLHEAYLFLEPDYQDSSLQLLNTTPERSPWKIITHFLKRIFPT